MMMPHPAVDPRPGTHRCGRLGPGVLPLADMPEPLPATMVAPLPPAGRGCVTGSGGGCTRSVRQSRDLPPVC